jgi:hypothetical protein
VETRGAPACRKKATRRSAPPGFAFAFAFASRVARSKRANSSVDRVFFLSVFAFSVTNSSRFGFGVGIVRASKSASVRDAREEEALGRGTASKTSPVMAAKRARAPATPPEISSTVSASRIF